MLLSLKSDGSGTLQHLVKLWTWFVEGEGENTYFQCKFGIPGSAPLAENCPRELGAGGGEWAHLPMGHLCDSFLWDEHLRWWSVGSGCPPIIATLPRVEWEAGRAWKQLPSLEHVGSGWEQLACSFGICHLLMWKLPFLPKCTFLSHEGFYQPCAGAQLCVCPSSVISSHIASHLRARSFRPAWPCEVDGLGLVLENSFQCLSPGRSDSDFYFLNCSYWNACWTSRYSMRLA